MDENNWNKYVIECDTFRNASEIAANKDLWLHAWTWLENAKLTEKNYRFYVNTYYIPSGVLPEGFIAEG
jgi:hypothetical protein